MPAELVWQKRIIDSVKKQGGYGKKWATQYSVGVPDLVLALPRTGGFFMEVKTFREAKPGFDRQIGTTPKQKFELARLNGAGALAMVGVTVGLPSGDLLLLCPPGRDSIKDGGDAVVCPWRGGKEMFDMIGAIDEYLIKFGDDYE